MKLCIQELSGVLESSILDWRRECSFFVQTRIPGWCGNEAWDRSQTSTDQLWVWQSVCYLPDSIASYKIDRVKFYSISLSCEKCLDLLSFQLSCSGLHNKTAAGCEISCVADKHCLYHVYAVYYYLCTIGISLTMKCLFQIMCWGKIIRCSLKCSRTWQGQGRSKMLQQLKRNNQQRQGGRLHAEVNETKSVEVGLIRALWMILDWMTCFSSEDSQLSIKESKTGGEKGEIDIGHESF